MRERAEVILLLARFGYTAEEILEIMLRCTKTANC